MEKRIDQLVSLAKSMAEDVELHKRIAEECGSDLEIIEIHDEIIFLLREAAEILQGIDVADNYLNQFNQQIALIPQVFPFLSQVNNSDLVGNNNSQNIKNIIQQSRDKIKTTAQQMRFNHEFFRKLGFFQHNIVAIGANGSGKTTLAYDLKRYLPQHGVMISAQKVLLIPTFSGISNLNSTSKKLQDRQAADKTYKSTYSTENNGNSYQLMTQLGGEFHLLLDNLLADRSATRNKYCDAMRGTTQYQEVPETKLDRALDIWNSLLPHRTITCSDGINITLSTTAADEYPAYQMSDGEKVLLFLVAQVLQAPKSGFIVVDEPEMYLHKTIVTKLWDTLEAERIDCIFIYLTHDLDFATSRTDAKKIWIKSFDYPNQWKIEDIPENELPEQLLLELIGSRKDILFCEGKNNSLDAKIFNILFPQFTICPVDSCFDVINYTKSFNKLPMVTTKAHGIIDSDYHDPSRLTSLATEGIYSYSMAEIENLLLDEEFLKIITNQLLKDQSTVENIKIDILNQLNKDSEFQASNYVSGKINYYFRNSHVPRGRSKEEIKSNFSSFVSAVDINTWHNERQLELEEVVLQKKYSRALQIYNNKGLKTIAQRHLKISDFHELAIRLLATKSEARDILKIHFKNLLLSIEK